MPLAEVKLASISFLYTYIDATSMSKQLEKTQLKLPTAFQEDLRAVLQQWASVYMFIFSNIVIFCYILNLIYFNI